MRSVLVSFSLLASCRHISSEGRKVHAAVAGRSERWTSARRSPAGNGSVAGGGGVARCAGDDRTDHTGKGRARVAKLVVGHDLAPLGVTPRAGAQRRARGRDGRPGSATIFRCAFVLAEMADERAGNVAKHEDVCGSGGPQARATPIAAPSKGEARRVGAARGGRSRSGSRWG